MGEHPKTQEILEKLDYPKLDDTNARKIISDLLYDAESSLNRLEQATAFSDEDGRFIPWGEAITMINNYQKNTNDANTVAFLVNAKLLLDYISPGSVPATGIKQMKFYLAKPSSAATKLTLVIVGTDGNNKHILYNGNQVIQHVMPCSKSGCGQIDIGPESQG